MIDPTPQYDPDSKFWIQTYTGRKVSPLNLLAEDLDIRDQIHALSNICRYGGHVAAFYSVAEHAVRISLLAEERSGGDRELAKWGLIHDNAEAYLGDMVRPLKRAPESRAYRAAEKKASRLIASWLGLDAEEPQLIQQLDTEILGLEATTLKAPVHPEWRLTTADGKPLSPIAAASAWAPETASLGWTPETARSLYRERFRELFRSRPESDFWAGVRRHL